MRIHPFESSMLLINIPGKREMLLDDTDNAEPPENITLTSAYKNIKLGQPASQNSATGTERGDKTKKVPHQDIPQVDSVNEKISCADLLVMQSSFDSKCLFALQPTRYFHVSLSFTG